MRCPDLNELPPPPEGRMGWPWTEPSARQTCERKSGVVPRISIVTPSYNQGHFIEETIRSILLQGYPDLEYIIMDGGSTDDTVAVIERYAPWITRWRSERDRGQAHAINKGFDLATGDVFQFVNSDDVLAPGCLAQLADAYRPGHAYFGDVCNFSEDGEALYVNAGVELGRILHVRDHVHQPGVWLDAARMRSLGPFDESYSYYFDTKYLFQYFDAFPSESVRIDATLVRFRMHAASKTVSKEHGDFARKVLAEKDRMARELLAVSRSSEGRAACDAFLATRAWEDTLLRIEHRRDARVVKLARGALLALRNFPMANTKESKRFFRRVLRGEAPPQLTPATESDAGR